MRQFSKTIEIYLPDGEPRGIRVAEIKNRIVKVIDVPKVLLPDFLKMSESQRGGFYFLIDSADDARNAGKDSVYVGESGNLSDRLSTHNSKKEWERALVVTTAANSLTQGHTLYLESQSITSVKDADRYVCTNKNDGTSTNTPVPLRAECDEIFELAKVLLATLGYPLFAPLKKRPEVEVFFCRKGNVTAKGYYSEDGFVVLQGSTAFPIRTKNIDGNERIRIGLVESGALEQRNGLLAFPKDHIFRNPSKAAMTVLGNIANGGTAWKNEAGLTLNSFSAGR